MTDFAAFSVEQGRLLWQDYLRRQATPNVGITSRGPRPMGTQPPITVILDEALDVATDSKTGATSCLATRLAWFDVDEEYTETTDQITVWNHSESQSYEADTFGKAEWIDGHWWFVGDCGPMGAR
jgi:hypothetical protein